MFFSTEEVDPDGDVVIQKGIDLSRFNKNPTILSNHEWDKLPIGRGVWTVLEEKKIPQTKQLMQFWPRPPEDILDKTQIWEPDIFWWACSCKILKGVSIGFITLEAGPPTTKEIQTNPKWASAKRIVRKSLLYETSLCTQQCNNNTLVQEVSKGFYPTEQLEQLGFMLPEEELHDWWTWEQENYEQPKQTVVSKRLEFLQKLRSGF